MSSIVREYDEQDFEQVLTINHSAYAKRTGCFSLISQLKDSRMIKKYVVTNENARITGYGFIWEQRTSPYLILKVEILFHPEYEVEEILFEKIMKEIQMIRPHAIQARTFHDQIHLLRYYEKHGFIENHRMMHVYLPISNMDLTPFSELDKQLESQDIMLTTLAEERISEVDYLGKWQILNHATWDDYPSEPLSPRTSPNDLLLTHEDIIPEAYFIAKWGPLYIGHSCLMKLPSDPSNLIQGLTASLREFRGKGIATALKVKGIEYAQRMGYAGIFTSYRNTNLPMKAINLKLGWCPNYSEVRLEKIFASSQSYQRE